MPRTCGASSTLWSIGSIAGVPTIPDRVPQCAIAHKAGDDIGYSLFENLNQKSINDVAGWAGTTEPNLLLRPRQRDLPFGAKHVAVEIGYPLSPARGDVEIADRRPYVRRHAVPVELRVEVDEVGRRGIAELAVHPGLLEFVIERVRLADVVGIAELADQVGGAQQRCFLVVFLFFAWNGCRKARALDRARDPPLVELRHALDPLHHEYLRAVDVIGQQRRIR